MNNDSGIGVHLNFSRIFIVLSLNRYSETILSKVIKCPYLRKGFKLNLALSKNIFFYPVCRRIIFTLNYNVFMLRLTIMKLLEHTELFW